MERSYLFIPGHNEKLLGKAYTSGADAVMFDLEDSVPEPGKELARTRVVAALANAPDGAHAWVRINAPRTVLAARDLDAVGGIARGIRIPKVESPGDVDWVRRRAPGIPLICAIESARGLLAAQEIATAPNVRHLSIGGVDLRRDLHTDGNPLALLHARSHLVICSRAAGIEPPIDSVYARLDDEDGLRTESEFARSLGFFGKSAIHPKQLATIHQVFTPSADEIAWAHAVLEAFTQAGRGALRMPDGEFVDLPVAQRAERVLALSGAGG